MKYGSIYSTLKRGWTREDQGTLAVLLVSVGLCIPDIMVHGLHVEVDPRAKRTKGELHSDS
jgi:hypothetical protein